MTPTFNPKNFILMEGAGNSFAILDAFKHPEDAKLSPQERAQLATRLGETFGKTLDGLIFLEFDEKYDFVWDFYNNDGSSAEMCGNAARCVSRYFLDSKQQKIVKFKTRAGVISGAMAEKEIAVTMTPTKSARTLKLKVDGFDEIEGYFIDTGVPHFVLVGSLNVDLARKLRGHREFFPAGTNVTFITDQMRPGVLSAQTFERGVEGFTAACGTGAVAAAFFDFSKNPQETKCAVKMPGGVLTVTHANPPLLIGPANYLK
jgi:diaminopimelate epimerase